MGRNILSGISLFSFILGQYFMFVKANFVLGGIFTIIAIAIGVVIYLKLYVKVFDFFMSAINGLMLGIKGVLETLKASKQAVPAGLKTGKASPKDGVKAAVPVKSLPSFILPKLPSGKVVLPVTLPKWLLFCFVFLIFGAGQIILMQGNWKLTLMVLTVAVGLFIFLLLMKEKALNFNIVFDQVIQLLLMAGGLFLILVGWVFLINPAIVKQYWGVAFTTVGVIVAFLGLPQADLSGEIEQKEQTKTDILLQKPAWLNNYLAKAIFIAAAFIFFTIANKYIRVPESSMSAIYLYVVSGFFVFLALPLFNFPEEYKQNKIMDIIRLAAAGIAMYIAYVAQSNFAAQKPSMAVIYYVIAAAIFITFFPVYKTRETEEKEPFPLKLEIICFLIVFAIAIFFRTYQLGSVPFGIENDEAGGYTGHVNGPMRNVGWYGIYFHIIQFLQLFTSDPRLALKGMGVSVGIISIPALYFLLRFIFNPRTAIFGTMVFSVLRWNVHYGRFGQGAIFTPIAEIFALYFLFMAFEKRNKFIWFIAGVAVGVAWHGVMTTWLIIVPIILYLLLKSLDIKGFFKMHLKGIIAFILGFWLFGSMIVHNYFISDKVYFTRIYEVSVFGKDPNAPNKNVGAGIVLNTDLVLKMFNYHGDSRQRNSGGEPNEPGIDFVSGMFYAVGFLYAIYYSKFYSFFILMMLFFSQAAGSIFSIEAPSAMRAVGTMIPAIIFITLIFDKIWLAFRRVFGKKWEYILLPLLLLVTLFPIVKENYRQYFQRWIGGFDELATASGMYAKELGMNTRVILFTSLFYPGHPPYSIHRGVEKSNSTNQMAEAMSYFAKTDYTDGCSFFYNYDMWENIDNFKNVYFPESKIVDVDHKYFNKKGSDWKFFKAITVTKEHMEKIRGLDAKYYFSKTNSTENFRNEAPLFKASFNDRLPYTVTWDGGLMTPYYGEFRIINSGNAPFEAWVNGVKLEKEKYYTLPMGLHHVVIKSSRNSAADTLNLKLEAKKRNGRQVVMSEILPCELKMFYNLPRIGFYAKYYSGDAWDMGEPAMFEYIDPFLWITGIPYNYVASQSWFGNIRIPEDGNYRFFTQYSGYVRIVIDGKYYWQENGAADKALIADKYFSGMPMQKVDTLNLKKGMHKIAVYAIKSSVVKLSWQKSGGVSEPVPMELITPDYKVTAKQ